MSGPFRNAIEGIEPKSRGSSFWAVLLLVVFIVGGFYYTLDSQNVFTDHEASSDFRSLVYAFESLAVGDMDGFIEGVVGGMTVIALFMVMFALLHFLFTTALKPLFPKSEYALILSLVMTAYAFIDPKIYNYLLNLNAFVVGFLVFVALLIMMWGFTSHSGSDVLNSFNGISELKKHPELINDKKYVRELRATIEKERRRQY